MHFSAFFGLIFASWGGNRCNNFLGPNEPLFHAVKTRARKVLVPKVWAEYLETFAMTPESSGDVVPFVHFCFASRFYRTWRACPLLLAGVETLMSGPQRLPLVVEFLLRGVYVLN